MPCRHTGISSCRRASARLALADSDRNTLIGGGLAGRLAPLWRGDERRRLPELASAAVRANAAFLQKTIALATSGNAANLGELRDARRDVANAALNAEDSFQRLMSDHHDHLDTLEPIMAFLIYVRRIGASTAALAVALSAGPRPEPDGILPFANAADDVLTDLAEAVVQGREPAPFPPIGAIPYPDASRTPVVHQRVVRLARQLKLMHDAVARWAIKA